MTTIFLLYASISCGHGKNIWEEFVKNPSEINYRLCKSQIEQLERKDEIVKQLINNVQIYRKYLNLVETGDLYALELAFQLQDIIAPGGNLEDIYIAMGKTINLIPEHFLYLADKYKPNNESLSSILLMYGDEYVDNIDKTIKETELRIASLSKVTNEKLINIKNISIAKLTDNKKSLLADKRSINLISQINNMLINDPESALEKIIKHNITDELAIFGVLGWDLPNDETRIDKISERIKFIEERVKKKELLDFKRKCIQILNNEKDILIKIKGMSK